MPASTEYTTGVIARLREAADANRATPCRVGNVIWLGDHNADDVLVAADLHGHRLNFERILQQSDLPNHPRRHVVMQEVCHGGPTYPVAGGCMSHLLLEDIAGLKLAYPERFHFILSNHELAELTDFPIMKASRMLNLVFRTGLQEFYGDRAEDVRDAYLEFLRSCPLAVRLASGVFISHSAPEGVDRDGFDVGIFERPLTAADFAPHGPVFRLVWGRDFRAENATAFADLVDAKLLIHGHEPCPDGYQVPNDRQVIIDCCGERACCVTLPVVQAVSQAEVVARIEHL